MRIYLFLIALITTLMGCKKQPESSGQTTTIPNQDSAVVRQDTASSPEVPTVFIPQALPSQLSVLFSNPIGKREEFLSTLTRARGARATDSLVWKFLNEYGREVQQISKSLASNKAFQNEIKSEAGVKTISAIESQGFAVKWNEARASIDISTQYVHDRCKDFVSEEMNSYLILREELEREGLIDDEGLMITWDQLGERIIAWESFLASYPHSFLTPEVKRVLGTSMHVFAYGTENTPVFSPDSTLNEDVRLSYDRFVAANPTSLRGKVISEYLEALKVNGFRNSRQTQALLKKKLLGLPS